MELNAFKNISPSKQSYTRIPEDALESGGDAEDRSPEKLKNVSDLWRPFTAAALLTLGFLMLTLSGSPLGDLGPPMIMSAMGPYSVVKHPEKVSSLWGSIKAPFPTGAFWTNFVVENGDAPANLLPYGIKCVEGGIQTSYNPTRRTVNELVVSDPFDNDLQITAVESYVSRGVSDYGPVSVSMQYNVANQGKYTAHLVKGAAFVTVSFENGATPVVKAPNMQIINVEVRDAHGKKVADLEPDQNSQKEGGAGGGGGGGGVQYLLDLGNFQKWLVYVSDARVALVWDKAGNTLTASSGSGSGQPLYVRIAILPPRKDPDSVDAAFGFLLQHAQYYPTGATADISYDSSNIATIQYKFSIRGPNSGSSSGSSSSSSRGRGWWHWSFWSNLMMSVTAVNPLPPSPGSATGRGSILMYALPHHLQAFTESTRNLVSERGRMYLPSMYCLKGPLSPVVGDTWEMRYRLPDPGWDYTDAKAGETEEEREGKYATMALRADQLDAIAKQVTIDVAGTARDGAAPDTYTFGKEVARLAGLAIIADFVSVAKTRTEAIDKTKHWLEPWLLGTNDDHLVYDRSYGGLVSIQSVADKMADFGMGWYNDHHFHYGYFVYANAVMARLDRPFYKKHQSAMDAIASDICTYSHDSSLFPYTRHKDLFDGHSWASGLFSMANGKGQESSSEAVNAYYACYLYGQASGNMELTRHSQLMLAMEVEAAKLYWHMPDARVYDASFASNVMAGNVGAFDVTSTTWFGSNLEYVHGINILPVTPASALLLRPGFVSVEWPVLANRLPSSERGAVLTPQKISDRNRWELLTDADAHTHTEAVPTTCEAHSACAVLNLAGDCCPNAENVYLACCSGTSGANTGATTASDDGSGITEEWRAVLFQDMAVVDRENAFTQLSKLTNLGPGASKANALLWAMTRPQSDSTLLLPAHEASHSIPRECAANSACDANGMMGKYCCPGDDGGMLACCPKVTGVTNTRRYR